MKVKESVKILQGIDQNIEIFKGDFYLDKVKKADLDYIFCFADIAQSKRMDILDCDNVAQNSLLKKDNL